MGDFLFPACLGYDWMGRVSLYIEIKCYFVLCERGTCCRLMFCFVGIYKSFYEFLWLLSLQWKVELVLRLTKKMLRIQKCRSLCDFTKENSNFADSGGVIGFSLSRFT